MTQPFFPRPPHRSDPLHELEPSVAARPQTLGGPEPPKGKGRDGADSAEEEFLRVEFRPNYERGCSYYFGYRAVRRFLDENGLLCLVRAHQVQEEGFRRHFDSLHQRQQRRRGSSPLTHDNVRELLPPVITVFSAPNYAGRYGNKVWMDAWTRVSMRLVLQRPTHRHSFVSCHRPIRHRPPSSASGWSPRRCPSSSSSASPRRSSLASSPGRRWPWPPVRSVAKELPSAPLFSQCTNRADSTISTYRSL